MLEINYEKCTGCMSCKNKCPVKAIDETEFEGFKYPKIDQTKCINCNLCNKVCPLNKKNNSINTRKTCYAATVKNKKYLLNSSSGGIFPLIARYVLKNKGIVIGASFNKENQLYHIAITSEEELDLLIGSKYIQSDLSTMYQFVKENIKEKNICFVGLPCQIAGLKSYLNKEYENLITIDLICHGVPSQRLFDKYVNELEKKYKSKLIKYNFRDKRNGWENYSNVAIFKNKEKIMPRRKNLYMDIFLSDIALRKSCYDCNFKIYNKYSDITLGDFWNVQKIIPDMYDTRGVSSIIINSNKGQELFENIKEDIKYKECTLEDVILSNPSLKQSAILNKNREFFINEYDKNNLSMLAKKYIDSPSFFDKVKRKIKTIIKTKILKK